MAKYGKISVIKKDYSTGFPTLELSLGKNGFTQFPGTKKRFFPDKNADGSYKTGLSPELREKYEKMLGGGIDLGPRSNFWKTHLPPSDNEEVKASSITLEDGDNLFNLDEPIPAITYYWLSANRFIAKSLEAYERGDYPAETQFYVADDNYEDEIRYRKAKEVNDAVILFESFSLEKRKKIVRLMGVPVTDEAKEITVYNEFDKFIKAKTVPSGPYKGMTPVIVFKMFSKEQDDIIDVKDLVEKIINNQILRVGLGGAIFEGEERVFVNKDSLIETLLSDKNQDVRMLYEKKLNAKLLSATL